MSTEADICQKYILPRFHAVGWTDDHVAEKRAFNNGRAVVQRANCRPGKLVDYLPCQGWGTAVKRAETNQKLGDKGMAFQHLALQEGKSGGADTFDGKCHLAFKTPIPFRRQRVKRVRTERAEFVTAFAPECRQILEELLENYTINRELQSSFPDSLKVLPISLHGNAIEITDVFGEPNNHQTAWLELQKLLYALGNAFYQRHECLLYIGLYR